MECSTQIGHTYFTPSPNCSDNFKAKGIKKTEAEELQDTMISGKNRVNEQMNLQGSEHGIGEVSTEFRHCVFNIL